MLPPAGTAIRRAFDRTHAVLYAGGGCYTLPGFYARRVAADRLDRSFVEA